MVDDGLEGLWVVHGEVGKDLAVDFDTRLGELVHELAVVHAILAHGGVDTDNPQATEFALFVSSVAISILLTLFVRVLRHSPHVLSRAELTFGLLQDFLSSGSDLGIAFDFFVQRLAPFENFSAETNYTLG